MSKSRQHRNTRPASPAKPQRPRVLVPPNWPVIGLAGAGVLLTAYLTLVAWLGAAPLFCGAESSCDVVQQSDYSRLFGLPLSLYGLALYVAVLVAAWVPATRLKRWRRVWVLSLIGFAISVYLTAVAAYVLGAFCGWCLVSLLLIGAIFGLTLVRQPESALAPGQSRRNWVLNYSSLFVAVMLAMGLAQSGVLDRRNDPRLEALAIHLSDTGARYYGAAWCNACQSQTRRFGDAARRLPYVECQPGGPRAPINQECSTAGVESFPTWIIRGQRHQGLIEPRELARLSRFPWDRPREE